MASGKTDNLLKAILAEGKDPETGEYLSPAERKAMFKKVKISGSKVFGRGGGGGNVRGGSRGSLPGAGGGALALRNPQADAMDDIASKLDNILVLIKRDADQERKQRTVNQEAQRKAREKLLRGSAETQLESVNKEKEKKTDDAKKGIKMQIPFLEKLAKFLTIYVAGWATDKFIKMYQAALDGNISELLKYRDILINQLGKLFAPVANIANGFLRWITRTVVRIGQFGTKIGKKVFTKAFTAVRRLAVGMLNRLKSIVQNPMKFLTDKAGQGLRAVQGGLGKLGNLAMNKVPGLKGIVGALQKGSNFVGGLSKKAAEGFGGLVKGGKAFLNPLKALKKLIPKFFGKAAGKLGGGLLKLFKGNIGAVAIGSLINIRERLAAEQSPTQAIMVGLLKGLASGVIAGTITAALSGPTFGLGALPGLLLGGFLGEAAGNLLVGPLDDWFSKQPQTENAFDKWFNKTLTDSPGTIKSIFGYDTREANAAKPSGPAAAPQFGTGNQSRLSPGGAVKNADVITPQRKPRVSTPTMPPVSASGGQSKVQTVPNKQQVTGLPSMNPTNDANPYLAFSYSIYNVLV